VSPHLRKGRVDENSSMASPKCKVRKYPKREMGQNPRKEEIG
jgi:hypothetical protein